MPHDDAEERERAADGAAPGGGDAPGSPWRTLGAREVYRNPWITVTEYRVVRPDGTPGIYGVVDPHDNAAVVALDDAGRVTLVGEFLYPLGVRAWMIPSGQVEAGEDPLAAARRELAEETGLEADDWLALGAYYLSSGISTQTSYAYLARGLRAVPARPEATERLEVRRVPLVEARALCLRNAIRDAPSVIALWRAWERLHGGE
jgi:8-oxo-dGTP pyrophosphatase MutT (NUDIX family)